MRASDVSAFGGSPHHLLNGSNPVYYSMIKVRHAWKRVFAIRSSAPPIHLASPTHMSTLVACKPHEIVDNAPTARAPLSALEEETQESLYSESWGNARGVLAAASLHASRDGYDTYRHDSVGRRPSLRTKPVSVRVPRG